MLIDEWKRAIPAACDVTVTTPLTHAACITADVAAYICWKDSSNYLNCQGMGWVYILVVVEFGLRSPFHDWHLFFQSASAAQNRSLF